jgi:hypothetical protein
MVAQEFVPGAPAVQVLKAALSCDPSGPPDHMSLSLSDVDDGQYHWPGV